MVNSAYQRNVTHIRKRIQRELIAIDADGHIVPQRVHIPAEHVVTNSDLVDVLAVCVRQVTSDSALHGRPINIQEDIKLSRRRRG